ncbi:MAG: hypothetical protein NC311_00470 [Muribaculaceae bacterium]|nr:hypothetical protein [Muribaculaceae bacterium]
MQIVVSKMFLKWQKTNKSNKPLMDVIDRFLLSVYNATDITNVTPQPKAAGKNLRKMPETVDEFTLNKSYRIYSKCLELEPGVMSFCLATIGIKGKTNQNDDILAALNMFDDVANEKWTVWQPAASQLLVLDTADLSDTATHDTVTDVESATREPKKKKGKPLDENGLTVAQRKAQRKQQEAQKRQAAARQTAKQKQVTGAQTQPDASDADVARVAQEILAHAPQQLDKQDLSPDEQDAQKAIHTVTTALARARDLETFANEILASSSNPDIKKHAKKILDAVRAVNQGHTRTINAATAVAKNTNVAARQRALMVATSAARSVQQHMSAANVAYTAIQNIMTEIQATTTHVDPGVTSTQTVTETKSDDDTVVSVDSKTTQTDVIPDASATGDDIAPDEIRVINASTAAAPAVVLNGIPQNELEPITGDVNFEPITDIQYELALIEHNMNIERSRIIIAQQMITAEQSKIALEEMDIKKLQLLHRQKMQNMQK